MRLQIGALIEGPRADWALVRRLLHVQDFVHGKGAGLAETLAAFRTFEWLFFTMDISMVSKVILSPECLAADVTGIRPLVGVRTFMDQQIVAFGKLAIAEFADELLLRTGCSPRST